MMQQWELNESKVDNGMPCETAVLDAMLLDTEVPDGPGTARSRPWVYVLVDGRSQEVLAARLTFAASARLALDEMLRKMHEDGLPVPPVIEVDCGRDYYDSRFKTVTETESVSIKYRSPRRCGASSAERVLRRVAMFLNAARYPSPMTLESLFCRLAEFLERGAQLMTNVNEHHNHVF